MTVAAMYLRKSRAEEDEPLDVTLSRHRQQLAEFAASNSIIVAASYEEVASGDSLAARPQMLRLLADAHSFDAVLCMDVDRLGRGAMRDQGVIFDTLRAADTLIITPAKTYNLDDDLDDSIISFKALFAREEYKLIKNRLMRGKLRTVAEGGYVVNAPFGYRSVRVGKLPTLEVVPSEADAVRLIFAHYLSGDGCQLIADALNALGCKPHRSDKFSRTSVGQILRNPAYIGKVVWNRRTHKRPKSPGEKHERTQNPESDWLVFDGLHEPIIDPATFERAAEILAGRYHPPYRKPDEVKNPLAGVLYCSVCGRSMVRVPLYGKTHQKPIIGCPTPGCQMSSGQDVAERLMYTLLDAVKADLGQPEPEPDAPEPLESDYSENTRRLAQSELAQLNAQLNALYDLLERGAYDLETFNSRKSNVSQRIAAAESQLSQLTEPERTEREAETVRRGKLDSVLDAYWDGDAAQRNALLKSIVRRVEYSKPKGSPWNSPPSLELIDWAI